MYYNIVYSDELAHHGIKGQKWGVRRFQNSDGSLTDAGKKHQAKVYARQLNKKDKSTIRIKRKVKEADAEADRLEYKAKRTHNDAKRLELETAAKNKRNSVSEERNRINQTEKEIKSLVNSIKKEGYSVDSKEVRRSSARGADYAKALVIDVGAASVAALAGLPFTPLYFPTDNVKGTKYKVKG